MAKLLNVESQLDAAVFVGLADQVKRISHDIGWRAVDNKTFNAAGDHLDVSGNLHLNLKTFVKGQTLANLHPQTAHQLANAGIHIRNAIMRIDVPCQGCFSTALCASDSNPVIHYDLLYTICKKPGSSSFARWV
ncbi:Uncharacterised protein [Salmonella enterica subsp. enterica serovar Typhi]|nr:Uncharacterised protein [Salmonella enterica subsp. enterica serovar Typhi]CHL88947.1 Uncharacterised protein [Salmonella enterica subsp. enterica serovar Typhi]CRK06702.1 Uncharacterised protein [Salmonella enterica subsp. enterica serovar Typhi]